MMAAVETAMEEMKVRRSSHGSLASNALLRVRTQVRGVEALYVRALGARDRSSLASPGNSLCPSNPPPQNPALAAARQRAAKAATKLPINMRTPSMVGRLYRLICFGSSTSLSTIQ
jgi:hypothetical protein